MAKLEILGTPKKRRGYYRFSIRFANDLVVNGLRYYPEADAVKGPKQKSFWRQGGQWRKKEHFVIEGTLRFLEELYRQCRKRWGKQAQA